MTGPTPGGQRRVISLVPSITETIMAWGVRPAGVTRFCEVEGITTFGGTKNPDVGAIVAARPDVVLMDREENRRADADDLAAAGIEVVATDVRAVADVGPALETIAAAVGCTGPDPGAGPGRRGGGSERHGRRLRVWVPIWRRPWMTVGAATYGTSILAAAGLDNVYADSADPYPAHDLDDAASRSVDAVLAPSEPYRFAERHRAELEVVAPVVFVDGRDLFWWGVRTPAAMERLAELAGTLPAR